MPKVRRTSRVVASLVALPVAATTLIGCGAVSRGPTAGWHLGWRAETVFPGVSTAPATCRFVAKLSGSGSRVRLELTSGSVGQGYTLQAGWVAASSGLTGLDVVPGSSQQLHFGGKPSARVAPNASVLSDPLPFTVQPGTGMTVTLTGSAGDAWTKGIQTEAGGCTTGAPVGAGSLPGRTFNHPANPRWIRSVLVDGPAQRSLVAFGDSITELGGNYTRWSDQLAGAGLTVVNAGVGGGALSAIGLFGTPPGVERAQQVLAEPNVTDLMMLIGTNDLGFGISGAKFLASLDTVLTEAQQKGVQVYVGTIPPRTGYGWSAANEAQRSYVNSQLRGTWLRSRGAILVDTDAVLRDPAKPTRLLPGYDSGDGLHPNALGEARIGRAFLSVVAPLTPPTTPGSASPTPSSTPSSSSSTLAPSTPAPSETPSPSASPSDSSEPTPAIPGEATPTPTPTASSDAATGSPDPGASNLGTPDPSGSDPSNSELPSLDPAAIELAPQTANYLKVRATAPALATWSW
jgi:lysophospholipase L1-like esterase